VLEKRRLRPPELVRDGIRLQQRRQHSGAGKCLQQLRDDALRARVADQPLMGDRDPQ
jgi:hypothetical protein